MDASVRLVRQTETDRAGFQRIENVSAANEVDRFRNEIHSEEDGVAPFTTQLCKDCAAPFAAFALQGDCLLT